jgi:hypothetical protein
MVAAVNRKIQHDAVGLPIVTMIIFLMNILLSDKDNMAIINKYCDKYCDKDSDKYSFLNRKLDESEKKIFAIIFNKLFNTVLDKNKICINPKKNKIMTHNESIKIILGTESEKLLKLVIAYGEDILSQTKTPLKTNDCDKVFKDVMNIEMSEPKKKKNKRNFRNCWIWIKLRVNKK